MIAFLVRFVVHVLVVKTAIRELVIEKEVGNRPNGRQCVTYESHGVLDTGVSQVTVLLPHFCPVENERVLVLGHPYVSIH